jgi:hypothetical protein
MRSADASEMHRFERARSRWWNKPLVRFAGRALPAELAVLAQELGPAEDGAWLNSRGTRTGVIDLLRVAPGKYKTKRIMLPAFVSECLVSLYRITGLVRGAPDLIVWSRSRRRLRFAEVKCPHWDTPSAEQLKFSRAAKRRGIVTTIIEWEFTAQSVRSDHA